MNEDQFSLFFNHFFDVNDVFGEELLSPSPANALNEERVTTAPETATAAPETATSETATPQTAAPATVSVNRQFRNVSVTF